MSPPGGRAKGRILIGLALAIFAVALALAARPHDETNAERIDRITSELRCPVCQGLSVKDSPSQTAREMRALVEERVNEGRSDAQIEAEFRAAYGDWVLLSPPVFAWTGLVWLVPLAALAAGLALVAGRFGRSPPAPDAAARLPGTLERGGFPRAPADARAPAPLRTLLIAALIAAAAAAVATVTLPREAGDRAPGAPVTGSVPSGPSLASLEARAKANPRDIPTQLALADEYAQEGRAREAIATYQAVLALDKDSVGALDGLALILVQSNENDGALVALDRVLALRPRDPDALFLKGLALYKKQDWKGAVDVWTIYLDVGEFHPAADMVRPLYADAKSRLGK